MEDNKLPPLPTPEEIEEQQEDQNFLINDRWQDVEVEPYQLDFTEGYKPPRYTLSWAGIPFAPLGGIHAITGQSGHGKTMTIAQFMATILCGEFGELRYELKDTFPNPKVLYIDTEMEEDNTIAVKNRVMTMCGRDIRTQYDDFIVYMLREVPDGVDIVETKQGKKEIRVPASVMRWRMVLKAINTHKKEITAVFIDGLIDVVADFNDNKECQETIYKCMQVASYYGISLWCIVHQNPGGEKLVGHLGSFLERKATDIIQTKKDKNATTGDITFIVSQKKARGRDWQDWKFRVEPVTSWGMPEQIRPAGIVEGDPMDEIEQWLKACKDSIEWPATRKTIKEVVIRDYGKQTNTTKQQVDLQKLLSKRILVETDIKSNGYPMLILNEMPF